MALQFFESNHRYKLDGEWVPAVTTALKGIPKDFLTYWAAKTVAQHAIDHVTTLASAVEEFGYWPAVNLLASVPDEVKTTAGVRGTEVHTLVGPYMAGEEIEVDSRLLPYVKGYAQFVRDWDPTPILDEVMCGSRKHRYAGRLDSVQHLPGLGTAIVDYKTGNGVYGEYVLQCAAYRYAEFYVDDDCTEHPMPSVDRVLILHIQPDSYDLYPVEADEAAFEKFLTAKANYLANVQSNRLAKLIGEPLTRGAA